MGEPTRNQAQLMAIFESNWDLTGEKGDYRMENDIDNRGITEQIGYILTHEDRINGGKVRSNKKKIAASLRLMKKCSLRCPLFTKCWAQPYSKSKYNGLCALKQFPEKIQKRTLDMVERGEQGFADQLTGWLIEASATEQDKIRLILTGIKLKDSIFGTKSKSHIEVNQGADLVKQLNEKIEEQKKIEKDKLESEKNATKTKTEISSII